MKHRRVERKEISWWGVQGLKNSWRMCGMVWYQFARVSTTEAAYLPRQSGYLCPPPPATQKKYTQPAKLRDYAVVSLPRQFFLRRGPPDRLLADVQMLLSKESTHYLLGILTMIGLTHYNPRGLSIAKSRKSAKVDQGNLSFFPQASRIS